MTSPRYYTSKTRVTSPVGDVPDTLFILSGNIVTGSELIGPPWYHREMPAALMVFMAAIRPGGLGVVECTPEDHAQWLVLWDEAARSAKPKDAKPEGIAESDASLLQTWAQGLIEQLPAGHQGRNSWLTTYGAGPEAERLRDDHPTYRKTRPAVVPPKGVTPKDAPIVSEDLPAFITEFLAESAAYLYMTATAHYQSNPDNAGAQTPQGMIVAKVQRMSRAIVDLTESLAQSRSHVQEAVTYLREAKRRLAPHTTNSDADDFIQRHTA